MQAKLTLYVNGASSLSSRAVGNIRHIMAEYLVEGHTLHIVDVTRDPDAAERARILATPTLVRTAPLPELRVTGDLSDPERVLIALELADATPNRDF